MAPLPSHYRNYTSARIQFIIEELQDRFNALTERIIKLDHEFGVLREQYTRQGHEPGFVDTTKEYQIMWDYLMELSAEQDDIIDTIDNLEAELHRRGSI